MSNQAKASEKIFGYADRFSARHGEELSFHVSCEGAATYTASLVQLHHGYTGEAGPGFIETMVHSAIEGSYPGLWHACQPGSYVEVDDDLGVLATPKGMLIELHVYATLPQGTRSGNFGAYHVTQNSFLEQDGIQTVLGNWCAISQTGYALMLEAGRPCFMWSDDAGVHKLLLNGALAPHHWYRLTVRVSDDEGRIYLEQSPVANIMNRHASHSAEVVAESASLEVNGSWSIGQAPFRIGSSAMRDRERWLAAHTFNGKVSGPRIRRLENGDLTDLAAWHFGRSSRADALLLSDVVDESPNKLHGRCYNAPTRAVAGHEFTGLCDDFRLAPDQYNAIHFHDDDITDAGWPSAFSFRVPQDLPSGVYAAKLNCGLVEHHVPFFVRAGLQKNKVAVLFSTATYLAYANDRIAFEANGAEIIVSRTPIIDQADLTLQDHPEFGRSCYEIHNDGSGVVYGSARRPILTMQPKHRAWFQAEGMWGLPADLCIVHWLETLGCGFDAITDEDLDLEGYELLRDYQVVITGSHPEYVTRSEIEAIEYFTSHGGRLMYLGGNGFFATASFDPEERHLMEVRRSSAGTRPHQSPFGDQRHATSGEMAGLWRNKGLPPQRLVGVGFVAQGFDRCTYYGRLVDSLDPLAAFVFEGIGENERIGDFGIMGGGAAGAEVDCYKPDLGTPPGALLLATSGPLSDGYLLAAEEVYESVPGIGGTERGIVRSDIVLCPIAGGGAFFSVGSIAYTGALSHNRYDNNIFRLTSNVLRRFLKPEHLDMVV